MLAFDSLNFCLHLLTDPIRSIDWQNSCPQISCTFSFYLSIVCFKVVDHQKACTYIFCILRLCMLTNPPMICWLIESFARRSWQFFSRLSTDFWIFNYFFNWCLESIDHFNHKNLQRLVFPLIHSVLPTTNSYILARSHQAL